MKTPPRKLIQALSDLTDAFAQSVALYRKDGPGQAAYERMMDARRLLDAFEKQLRIHKRDPLTASVWQPQVESCRRGLDELAGFIKAPSYALRCHVSERS